MKQLLLKSAAVLMAIGCTMCAVEVGLRFSDVPICRHSDHMFVLMEKDEALGWRMKRMVRETVDLFDTENILVEGNSDGFWDDEFSPERTDQRLRVAFLGDSFCWGYGVRNGQRFTDWLEADHPEIEGLNFGTPGYGTDQALLTWRNIAAPLSPDVVVLVVVPNDYVDNVSSIRWGRPKPYFAFTETGGLRTSGHPLPDETFWDNGILHQIAPPYRQYFDAPTVRRSRLADWLVKHLDLVRLAYTVSTSLPRGDRPRTYIDVKGPVSGRDLSPADMLQATMLSTLVLAMQEEVEERGGAFVAAFAGEHPMFDFQIRDFRRQGVRVLDLTTDVLVDCMQSDPRDVYFDHNPHWRPETHQVVARLVHSEINTAAR